MKLQYYIVVDIVTPFETKSSGGNENKVKMKRDYLGYKFYDSSRLFTPLGHKKRFLSREKNILHG